MSYDATPTAFTYDHESGRIRITSVAGVVKIDRVAVGIPAAVLAEMQTRSRSIEHFLTLIRSRYPEERPSLGADDGDDEYLGVDEEF